MPTKLELKTAEKVEKTNRLSRMFEAVKSPEGYNFDQKGIEDVRALNTELGALDVEIKGLTDLNEIELKNLQRIQENITPTRPMVHRTGGSAFNTKGMGTDGASEDHVRPNVGRMFVESKSFTGRSKGRDFSVAMPDIETKTLFQTSQGWDPFVSRLPRVALSPQQLPKIVDAIPAGTTNQHSIKFMLETVYTNAAAEAAEGGLYPEAALKLVEQLQAVVKLAVFLPVTDEQLEDEEQSRDYINSRLDLMMRQRLDSQLANGDGNAPNLKGLANITGVNARALATGDAVTDLILKAINDVRTLGFTEPSAALMNPLDWQSIQLMRTPDGLYIWGHPSMSGPATIWGLPVVTSTYIVQGTGYVGDFLGHTMLFYRRGIEFLVSNSHLDYFARGQLAIRADMRCSMVCFRPKAITALSGMPNTAG